MTGLTEMVQELMKSAQTTVSSNTEYKCQKCHDSGWVWLDKYTVDECECQKARRAERLLARSGLAGAIQSQTFDAFEVRTELQRSMRDTGLAYLDALTTTKKRKPWLYIGGNPGSGKTHICTAVCGELLKRNIAVRYMQWVTEERRLKAYVMEPDFDRLVDEYIAADVLYIDDLLKQKFTENPVFTEADIRIAFAILNERYLQDKPTIISSEWDLLEHLLPADEGTFSRVYERSKGYTINITRAPENNFRLMRGGA